MCGYYSDKLAAEKLRRCYDIASPRIQQYLRAEIDFVLDHIGPADTVLELGCGYGRVLAPLAQKAACLIGIDTSRASLRLARKTLSSTGRPIALCEMDAAHLGFLPGQLDVVACIQNGISAFGVDQKQLISEAVRVTRPGGKILFSSYSASFWPERLSWFEQQAREGLLGDIDYEATGNGVIACTDGFRAATVDPDRFRDLALTLNLTCDLTEVDHSSLFCIIQPR